MTTPGKSKRKKAYRVEIESHGFFRMCSYDWCLYSPTGHPLARSITNYRRQSMAKKAARRIVEALQKTTDCELIVK